MDHELEERIRGKAKAIRLHAIRMTYEAGAEGGHIAPGLSMAELIAVLYFGVMRYDPKNPRWPDRDRFILSKGHAVLGYYPALAEAGFFPLSMLDTFEKKYSYLSGHPCAKELPGVDCSAGSMGHGLSVGLGIALAAKMDGKTYHTYVMLGDGELEEGSVWEAIMLAPQLKTDNLTAIVDRNGLQHDAPCADVVELGPLADKWRAFGWDVAEANGHDIGGLFEAFQKPSAKPRVIIAHTVKGKGVSFMENKVEWHHGRLTKEQADQALAEIEGGGGNA